MDEEVMDLSDTRPIGETFGKRKTRVRKVSKRRPYGRILSHMTFIREISGVKRKYEYHATKGWRVTRQ